MNAVILAGGIGLRLGLEKPKCLLQVGRETLLYRHIINLWRMGISDVFVIYGSTGKNEVFEELDKFRSQPIVNIVRIHNPGYSLGSITGFAIGLSQVMGKGEPTIFINADTFAEDYLYDLAINQGRDTNYMLLFYDSSKKEGKDSYIVGVYPYGARNIRLGRVDTVDTYCGRSLGWYVLSVDAMKDISKLIASKGYLEQDEITEDYEIVFDHVMKDEPAEAIDITGRKWVDINYPENLMLAITMEASFRL
jgi:choline kinase